MSVVGKMVCAAVVLALCTSQGRSGSIQGSVQPASIAILAPPQKVKNLVFVEAPEIHLGEATKRFPKGSRLVRISLDELAKTNGPPIPLTTGLFAAADPQVSSDGQNLLFSGQMKHGGNWQIFTIPSGGGLARQLTHSAADCLHPLYLPDDFIAYTATQGSGSARSSQVEVSRSDGSQAQPITFGPGEFDVQTVLRSGRILLSANSPLTAWNGQRHMRAFYVMDPDGSGLTLLRQDDATSATSSDAEEGSDGTIIFVQQPSGSSNAFVPARFTRRQSPERRQVTRRCMHRVTQSSLYRAARKAANSTCTVSRQINPPRRNSCTGAPTLPASMQWSSHLTQPPRCIAQSCTPNEPPVA